jgi:hypothetical protein
LAFIPVNPETGESVARAICGMLYGHGTTIQLLDSPSDLWLDNEVSDIIFLLGDNLVSAVFGGSGAIAITMANPIKQIVHTLRKAHMCKHLRTPGREKGKHLLACFQQPTICFLA